jgi:hypothetical protein
MRLSILGQTLRHARQHVSVEGGPWTVITLYTVGLVVWRICVEIPRFNRRPMVHKSSEVEAWPSKTREAGCTWAKVAASQPQLPLLSCRIGVGACCNRFLPT